MLNRIEKQISNLIEKQFPQFYRSEGSKFIDFVKAYYEWMETENNVTHASRRIFENRDIDYTIEDFLVFFQKKYLYGIPFDVIINKRYLLKHVLDVYRSKGTIQCYNLLFKLIYNEDISVYLPGKDMLRLSDGKWKQPRYLEVNDVPGLGDYVGKEIYGLSSKVSAIVEDYVVEVINGNRVSSLYISNIKPRNADFIRGDRIIKKEDLTSPNLSEIVKVSPTLTGSLDYIQILNGGKDFAVGDLLKIARRDPYTNLILTGGRDGVVRVTNTGLGRCGLNLTILDGGSGISNTAADVFIYNDPLDANGYGASFSIQNLYNVQKVPYNEDLIAGYADLPLDSTAFGFPGYPSANISDAVGTAWVFLEKYFGGVLSLGNIRTGNSYVYKPSIYVRTTHSSLTLAGNVSYSNASVDVVGTGTEFTRFLSANSVIELQANTSNNLTIEKHIVLSIANDTFLSLYGKPSNNSTDSATYKAAISILASQYPSYDPLVYRADGRTTGEDTVIDSSLNLGNNIILAASAVDSGKGYYENEVIKLYRYGAIDPPLLINAGSSYVNGDILVFSGGEPQQPAAGYVLTDESGGIINSTMTYFGTGYTYNPNITIKSNTGSGGYLTANVVEFNTLFEITALVKKGGIGRKRGYWKNSDGFLNANKYIQDSYFYQDFSYQIRAATSISDYKPILYDTFHIAGSELFGDYLVSDEMFSEISLIDESDYITTDVAPDANDIIESDDTLVSIATSITSFGNLTITNSDDTSNSIATSITAFGNVTITNSDDTLSSNSAVV